MNSVSGTSYKTDGETRSSNDNLREALKAMNNSGSEESSVTDGEVKGRALSQVNSTDTPAVTQVSSDNILAEIMKQDHEAVNQLMLLTLSPELAKNEQQKRTFKAKLMKYIMRALLLQMSIVGASFIAVVVCACVGVSSEVFTNNIETMFSFLQYFITAIIAEFIAMLFFIVKYVFDKSIVDLLGSSMQQRHSSTNSYNKEKK